MTSKDYIDNAKKTESTDFDAIAARLQDKSNIRILHAAIGLSTESAELLDALKKHVYYGKPLDKTNLFEEAGDLFWYLAILADELGFDFEACMKVNLDKLMARYGDKFTSDKALTRDLSTEREILEQEKLS